jgi:hypothetical protein
MWTTFAESITTFSCVVCPGQKKYFLLLAVSNAVL